MLTDSVKNNILIDSHFSARIADFGLTSVLRNHSMSISVTAPARGGTLRWMAPELFNDGSHPSKSSDIYALGMVTYEVGLHCTLCRINLKELLCRFSHKSSRSLAFPLSLYPGWSSLANDPHSHRTGRFLASRKMSGYWRKSVGTGTRISGHISQISYPSLRRLPAIGPPLPPKKSRISASTVQSPPKNPRQGKQVLQPQRLYVAAMEPEAEIETLSRTPTVLVDRYRNQCPTSSRFHYLR